jgi:hypothetical protein
MKAYLELEQVLRQPRRWASLLGEGPSTPSSRTAEYSLVFNYLAKHFSSARRMVVQRRNAQGVRKRERFVLRPFASTQEAGATRTWLGLVCEFDEKLRALLVVDRVALQPSPLLPNERAYTGDILLESRPLNPAYCDNEGVAFLKSLPLAAEAEAAPTDRWREYLAWRRRLAETKAAESHPYTAWLRRPGRVIRYILSGQQPADQLRQRFQDEDLRAGRDARDPKSPLGMYRKLGYQIDEQGHRHHSVDIEYDVPTWNALSLPKHGELRVAMEGEIASLDIQREGLRRFAERQSQNLHLPDWLFNIQAAKPITLPEEQAWKPCLPLNEEQRDAVSRALGMDDLLLLWGPPGTGKTTVIAEICAQYALRGQRVLVASQANLAVEQALGRLPDLPCIRAAWVSTARRREGRAGDLRTGLVRWYGALAKEARRHSQRCSPKDPWSGFLSEWSTRLSQAQEDPSLPEDEAAFLRQANIIGATCNECGKPDFIGSQRFSARFDLVIVDEVSKASPTELLLAMLMGRRVLLTGDHRQLPPLFKDEAFDDALESGEIEADKLEEFRELVTSSWFDQTFRHASPDIRCGLRRQYRMHPQIMEAVNAFYADQPLLPGDGARQLAEAKRHGLRLSDTREGSVACSDSSHPTHKPGHAHGQTPADPRRSASGPSWLKPDQALLWIDTSHDLDGRPVRSDHVGSSRRNHLEVDVAAHLVSQLASPCAEAGLSLGVISFYRAQADAIRERVQAEPLPKGWLHPRRDINTVDQFQGSERDVIIVSLVRSGARLTGEFARDFRRINVALSRARRLLIVLGSCPTFAAASVLVPSEKGTDQNTRVYDQLLGRLQKQGALLPLEALLAEESHR